MHWTRILGIALIAAGAIALYFGWTATDSLTEQASKALAGRYTGETRMHLFGGGVAVAAGLALLAFGARR